MTVETASYISQLNPAYPAAGDPKSEGDDHLRLTKTVLQTQFPNLGAAAVTATAAQINAAAAGTGNTYTGTHDFTGAVINVPTQSATDNDTSAASTAFVQSAILASSGVSAVLPGQAGNSGKFLTTNGTSASWASVPGQSGTTITGNVTLTASSAAGMSVTPTAPGLYATLPDATTCSKATTLFSIYNAGDYDYGVKDSAGTQLGWVRARTGAMIGLADNSTAAGVWAYYGLEKTGITASYVNSTLANMGSTIRRIALDANRTCFLFGGTDCYAIVYDASTQTWGSATLVASGLVSGAFLGVLSATNQVLVSYGAGLAVLAVTLSISGNSITVNSPVTTGNMAGAVSSLGQLIAVGSSWVVSYARATTTTAIRAISVSGTTPTIGAESTISTVTSTDSYQIFASGSIVRTIANTTANTVTTCKPFTVSGSTLSAGTAATITVTNGSGRAFLNGNGNIVYHYINTTHYATIFKLTGTTEAASSVSLGTAPNTFSTDSDYVAVTASKTLFISHAAATTWAANILTDTAGTASAGTQITGNVNGNIFRFAGLLASGNNARTGMQTSNTGGINAQFVFDCSGTSPVLSSSMACGFGWNSASGSGFPYPNVSDRYGVRDPSSLIAGQSVVYLAGAANDSDLRFNAASIGKATALMVSGNSYAQPIGVVGASNNETFVAAQWDATNNKGYFINRVEAAA